MKHDGIHVRLVQFPDLVADLLYYWDISRRWDAQDEQLCLVYLCVCSVVPLQSPVKGKEENRTFLSIKNHIIPLVLVKFLDFFDEVLCLLPIHL